MCSSRRGLTCPCPCGGQRACRRRAQRRCRGPCGAGARGCCQERSCECLIIKRVRANAFKDTEYNNTKRSLVCSSWSYRAVIADTAWGATRKSSGAEGWCLSRKRRRRPKPQMDGGSAGHAARRRKGRGRHGAGDHRARGAGEAEGAAVELVAAPRSGGSRGMTTRPPTMDQPVLRVPPLGADRHARLGWR